MLTSFQPRVVSRRLLTHSRVFLQLGQEPELLDIWLLFPASTNVSTASVFPYENCSPFFKGSVEKLFYNNLLYSSEKHSTSGQNEQRPQHFIEL